MHLLTTIINKYSGKQAYWKKWILKYLIITAADEDNLLILYTAVQQLIKQKIQNPNKSNGYRIVDNCSGQFATHNIFFLHMCKYMRSVV